MNMKLESLKKLNKIADIIFPILLAIYPLRHIQVGAEWADTGYNYANFTYMDHMDDMWLFSTYLGNVIGNLFTKFPFGNTMMGLNIYTSLIVSLLALSGYFFFVKEIKIPKGIVFVGEFLAISFCWCPTAVLYNYLTYVLIGGATVLLYYALTLKKRNYLFFVMAGICLGINVFVRFSNLANMALIIAVWAMGIIRKEKFGSVMKQTGCCILGYVIGLGSVFGIICLQYGADAYIQGVMRLLAMPSEASTYTIASMVESQIRNYVQNMIWLAYMLIFVILGTIVYKILPKSWKHVKIAGYVICVFCGFYVLMCKNMFNMKYSTILSVFQWAVIVLTITLIGGMVVIFRKKFTEQEKILSLLAIIVMFITPLGSNNHLYSSINNVFFVAPYTLWLVYRFLRFLPKECQIKKLKFSYIPLKAMILCIFCMIMFQGTMFGWFYVFYEGNGGENLHTKIEGNRVLAGIKNDETRAALLQEISLYVTEADLKGKEVILYGDIPAMSYYLEMPFAISPWPDLSSYNLGIMEADLQEIEKSYAEGEELPVILMEKVPGTYVAYGREGIESLDDMLDVEKILTSMQENSKLKLLENMIENYNYKVTFENDKFIIFLSE